MPRLSYINTHLPWENATREKKKIRPGRKRGWYSRKEDPEAGIAQDAQVRIKSRPSLASTSSMSISGMGLGCSVGRLSKSQPHSYVLRHGVKSIKKKQDKTRPAGRRYSRRTLQGVSGTRVRNRTWVRTSRRLLLETITVIVRGGSFS